MKQWLLTELLAPAARRAGGQAAAALVAVGMAQQHESAVAAVIAWAVVSLGEIVVSSRARGKLIDKVRRTGSAN